VAEPEASEDASFWTIDQLATRCGHYCWLERRLFELAGSRASAATSGAAAPGVADPGQAEIRVFLSVLSARHADLAGRWRARLPVRAGVDPHALIVRPPGAIGEVLDLIEAQPDLPSVLAGLVEQILPRLGQSYGRHLARATPVSEAPVRATLELALAWGGGEVAGGRTLLQGQTEGPGGAGKGVEFGSLLQRRLEGLEGIFPRARAS
jgi:hypothetical protein